MRFPSLVILALLAVETTAVVSTAGEEQCPKVRVAHLRTRETRVFVWLDGDRSALTSHVFHAARMMLADSGDTFDVVVVAACNARRIGVAFRAFDVGMDCGSAQLDEITTAAEAWRDDDDEFDIALRRVVESLDEWRARRTCAIWGNDHARATLFWLLVGAAVKLWQWAGAELPPNQIDKSCPTRNSTK